MKRFAIAMALACALSASALAGEMPTGGYAPPAPDQPTESVTLTAPGDIPCGGYTQEASTDITLSVIETLLSLLSV